MHVGRNLDAFGVFETRAHSVSLVVVTFIVSIPVHESEYLAARLLMRELRHSTLGPLPGTLKPQIIL